MFGQNLSNVTAAKPRTGGAVYRAPLGTALPTDASTALSSAFIGLGFISEDGMTHSFSPSSENIKDWGGEIIYTYSKERPDTYSAKYVEALNVELLKTVYGNSNVTVDSETGAITITHNNAELEAAVYVIDEILKDGTLKRTVIPNGKPSEIGDTVDVHTDLIGYDLTITALTDESGNSAYVYILPASGSSESSNSSDPSETSDPQEG